MSMNMYRPRLQTGCNSGCILIMNGIGNGRRPSHPVDRSVTSSQTCARWRASARTTIYLILRRVMCRQKPTLRAQIVPAKSQHDVRVRGGGSTNAKSETSACLQDELEVRSVHRFREKGRTRQHTTIDMGDGDMGRENQCRRLLGTRGRLLTHTPSLRHLA